MLHTRVDFYLLSDTQPDALWRVACRLLEKAYLKGHRVFVACASKEDAEHLDELLWTFKDDSFIPHNLEGEGPEPPPPVHIGYQQEPARFNDILLNLTAEVPAFYSQFKRVIELVPAEEEQKVLSRLRYKTYKAKGCPIQTHHL